MTPTTTFFAFLGDSPIMVWKHGEPKPDMLFNEHDADSPLVHQNLLTSNIFLVLVREKMMNIIYYLVTQPLVKRTLFRMAHDQIVEGGVSFDPEGSKEFLEENPMTHIETNTESFGVSEDPLFSNASTQETNTPSPGTLERPARHASVLRNSDPVDERVVERIVSNSTNADDEENAVVDPGLPFISSSQSLHDVSNTTGTVLHASMVGSDMDEEDADVVLNAAELKSFKEARLDDDVDKVIVKPETEILLEEREKHLKAISLKSLAIKSEGDVQATTSGDQGVQSAPATYHIEGETLEYDDIRVGLSALNVYGTIGDSSYDPDVFNTFLDEIIAFKQSRFEKYEQLKQEKHYMEMANMTVMSSSSGVIPFTSRSVTSNNSPVPKDMEDVEFDPMEFTYEEFRGFVASRPSWAFLKKHMYLMKDVSISLLLIRVTNC